MFFFKEFFIISVYVIWKILFDFQINQSVTLTNLTHYAHEI